MKQTRKVKYAGWIKCSVAMVCTAVGGYAQGPKVQMVDRASASPTQVVSITGLNFGTDPTKLAVYFGGAKGVINTATDQLLEVQTPSGTTFDKISVFNTTSGLGSASEQPFFLDFGGTHGFDASKLQGQFDFAAGAGLYDHCLCDFDGDLKLDIATANSGTNSISLFKNGSSVGSFSFVSSTTSVGVGTIHSRCGDLNGDGLPDLVISETNGGTRLFVFRNMGSFSFNLSTVTIPGKKVKQIEIADMDGDGKSELIVSDQGAADLMILPNLTNGASITFGAPVFVPVSGAASTDGLSVIDLDGDSMPEIISSQFLTAAGNVVVLGNQSTPGVFSFANQVTLNLPGTLVDLKVGDLDGDQLPDIAVTQLLGSGVSIFLNKSANKIQFANPQTFATDDHPWGLDFGDLDGDGKLDIVTASVTKKSLTVLNSSSTSGNLAFTQSIISTTYINRHVKIADMDGDGKPDITFTSVDDNNNAILASKISIFRNAACMTPVVAPGGPITICTGFPLRLTSTVNGGVAYQWFKGGALIPSATNSYLDVTVSGQYNVTATAESASCVTNSNNVTVSVVTGTALGTASPTNNGPVCLKGTLQLSVADVGATLYSWKGPAGYSGTGLNPAAIANFTLGHAGRYKLDVYSGTCLAQQASTVVKTVSFPNFRVNSPGSEILCQGQTKNISIVPNTSNVTVQWYEQTAGLLTGETNSTLAVSAAGNYFGKVTSTIYPACAPAASDTITIKVIALPVPNFTVSSSAPCVGQQITFTDSSTSDPQESPVYNWSFGDGNSSTNQNPTHTYTTAAASVSAQLTVSYSGNTCPQTTTQTFSVQNAPPLSITSSTGSFTFCEGTSISLLATGTGFDPSSYQWSNSSTGSATSITSDGTYSVSAKASSGGCLITASQVTTRLPAPQMTISASPTQVKGGETTTLSATGLLSYSWHPGKTLSDSTASSPSAAPTTTTLYYVSGTGPNGCVGKDSILVTVSGEQITGKLKPKNFFSPGNGDTINEKWEVDNITTYPQCGVAIYDEKGFKVYESKPYVNDWDGTYNGRLLPVGVYYYIIRCDGDNMPKTGSITLVR